MRTRQEMKMLLGTVQGVNWIMASLLYGTSRRLLECLRLRVKGIDLGSDQIVAWEGRSNRGGQGGYSSIDRIRSRQPICQG